MQENTNQQENPIEELAKKEKIVRAIDLGFGFTKLVQDVHQNGRYKAMMFPSIVTRASSKDLGA